MRLSFSILLLAASLASVQAASTNRASASCLVPGNRGMGTGEGWKDYCCENSDDCRDTCIKGKCNGKANPKPPTDDGSNKCINPKNRGTGTGKGWKDYCCENSDDCRDTCIKGKCNGKANPNPPTDPGNDKCLVPNNRGMGTGEGWKDYCCENSDDCRDTCIKGKCNGKANPNPPTDPGNDKCLVPSNRGMGTGEGWKDYCCENSDDCRDTCIKGKCNGKANPNPPTDPGNDKCLVPNNRGMGTGEGWKDYCCEDSDDCRDTCIKGKCNGKANPKPPTDDGSNKCINPKNRGTGTGKGWKDYCCEDSDDCRDTCIKGKCNGKADPKGAKTLN